MPKFNNLRYLFVCAWQRSKGYCLITVINNIFNAFLPLVNMAGLGAVVNALVINEPYENVLKIIIIYLSINLGIAIIKEVLNLVELIIIVYFAI